MGGRRGGPRGPVLLIDYLSLLYRAFYSVPDSVETNGVHGLVSMVARLVVDRHPTALAVAVDEDWRPAFRVAALPTYKTHRVADEPDATADEITRQEEIGRAVLDAVGVAVVGAPRHEAEDVIATLAARTRGRVEIVSGDRDLFALVRDPDVAVLYPVVGVSTLAVVDEAEITRRFAIPGRAYGDYALLRGDPSDGLPGVPGIGQKTAADLMRRYGSLMELQQAEDVPLAVARKLAVAVEYLAAARRVVPPVTDAPVRPVSLALPTEPAHPRRLARLVTAHRLRGPVERLQHALATAH